jgi:hypothetical protein
VLEGGIELETVEPIEEKNELNALAISSLLVELEPLMFSSDI